MFGSLIAGGIIGQMLKRNGLQPEQVEAIVEASFQDIANKIISKMPDMDSLVERIAQQSRWRTRAPQRVMDHNAPLGASLTFYGTQLADCRGAKRVLIYVTSTFDQAVDVQLVGDSFSNEQASVTIGSTAECPARTRIAIGPQYHQWHPFMGVYITTGSTGPTTGAIRVVVVVQE